MTRTQFINDFSKRVNLPKKQAAFLVDELTDLVVTTLKRKQSVPLNIGKFEIQHRAQRNAVNPATGKKITVAARTVPKFKPSKSFKEEIALIK